MQQNSKGLRITRPVHLYWDVVDVDIVVIACRRERNLARNWMEAHFLIEFSLGAHTLQVAALLDNYGCTETCSTQRGFEKYP